MAHNGDSSSESHSSGVDSNSEEEYGFTPEDIEALFAQMDADLEEERRVREASELAALLGEEHRLAEETRALMEVLGLTEDMFRFWLVEIESWEEGDELVFIPSEDDDDDDWEDDEGRSGEGRPF